MTARKWIGIGIAAVLVIALSGCQSRQESAEVQKKLDEMQKQLDDAKKELEATKALEERTGRGATRRPVSSGKAALIADKKASEMPGKIAQPQSEKAAEPPAADRTAVDRNAAEIAATKAEVAKTREEVAEVKRAAAPPPSHTLAAGTPVVIRTTSLITTKTASSGSTFEASLEEPLEVDGYVIAPKGATVEGVVANADPGGRVKGVASLGLELRSITTDDGRVLPIRTSSVSQEAKKSKGKDAAKVGIASGIGAAIGAIAGGGKGAAIGAGAGAAGGTGMVLGTRGSAAEVPPETVLRFTLSAPVKVQEAKR